MNPEELHRRFEEMFQRMLRAGWIHQLVFTEGKGWKPRFTKDGAAALKVIRHYSDTFGIVEADQAGRLVHIVAKGLSLGGLAATPLAAAFAGMLMEASFATGARIEDGRMIVSWTPAGLDFQRVLCRSIDELGLSSDEDEMLTFFHVCDGWAVSSGKAGAE